MAHKHKPTKREIAKKDANENSKFLLIVLIATVALMVLMYVIFV